MFFLSIDGFSLFVMSIGMIGFLVPVLMEKPHLLIAAIFILSFLGGLGIFVGLQPVFPKLGIELTIILLFTTNLLKKRFRNQILTAPAWKWMFAFTCITFISYMINVVPFYSFVYFLRIILVPYIFLIVVTNMTWEEKEFKIVLSTILFVFLLQIPASWVKLALIGPAEVYIGTISVRGGSITTILVMLATCYLAVRYYTTGQKTNFLLLFGFLSFGIIGNKRALIGYVPLVWIMAMVIYSWKNNNSFTLSTFLTPSSLKNLMVALLGGVLVFYTVVRLNPTLNPEGVYGGSFDIGFVVDYVIEYNSRESRDPTQYTGRLNAPKYVINAVSKNGLKSELFGLGAGIITASRFAAESKDYQKDVLGLGYGARNGVWYLLLQVGWLGVFMYFGFIFSLFKTIGKQFNHTHSRYWKDLTIICQLAIVVYLFDTLTYSKAMMTSHALILPVLWLVGVIINRSKVHNLDL